MLLAALAVGVACYFGIDALGTAAIDRWYLSDDAIAARNLAHERSLQEYVSTHGVSSRDTLAIEQWSRGEKKANVIVYQAEGDPYEAGSWGTSELLDDTTQSDIADLGYSFFTVQFADGAVKAQLGVPDMRVPIQYAFSYPLRLQSSFERLDLFRIGTLTFEEPDTCRFRNLALAYEALYEGGNMPCIVNAANEVVNRAFLEDRIGFLQMSDVIANTMREASFIKEPTYEDYLQTDAEARRIAAEYVGTC